MMEKKGVLTDEQVKAIKEQILASIYEDIGRSVVKKILWALGAALFVLLTWAQVRGYIKILTLLLLLFPVLAFGEPIYRVSANGATVTLHSEPCQLQEVTNLPRRATWEEKGKIFEGCYAVSRELQIVMAYFVEDRTVTAIPAAAFEKVSGI